MENLSRVCNEILILATIGRGRKHGYQIALDIEERSDGFFTFHHGTLYPILHELEKEGLIEGTWSRGEGRRRKEYTITDEGRRYLRRRADSWRTLHEHLDRYIDRHAAA